MKQRTPAQRRLLCIAFAGLALLLALLLWQGIRRGDAVRVGVPRSASAFGAAMLLQTPSAQYRCTLGSTPEALATVLQAGELDAALLPRAMALSMEGCEISAVVGYEPLAVITRQPALNGWGGLDGQTLTLSEALRETDAPALLRQVLKASHTETQLTWGDGGDPFVCSLDQAAAILAADADARILASVSRQWQKTLTSPPPAGLCLVVRQDYLARAGSDFDAFRRALQSSLRYGSDKRKKTVAMAVAAGLADSEELADALYDCVDFIWLTGDAMGGSLRFP